MRCGGVGDKQAACGAEPAFEAGLDQLHGFDAEGAELGGFTQPFDDGGAVDDLGYGRVSQACDREAGGGQE